MFKRIIKNPHTAQGMVEFALVLPVFLLLVMGMFAVGHYLFTYSFVLSASREAARYGAAIGKNEYGVLRFQDCDGIMAAATRVGNIAGVNPANIVIEYDEGPDTAITGDCPAGGTGPEVKLGDRIEVQIAMPYEPIVPLITFPPIVVRANTARTIVRDVSIGQALDSDDHCVDTETELLFTGSDATGPNPAVVGQLLTFKSIVTAEGETNPIGSELVSILDIEFVETEVEVDGVMMPSMEVVETLLCTMNTQGDSCQARIYKAGVHSITARFNGLPGEPTCYNPSEHFNYEMTINPAETITAIVSDNPDPSIHLEPVQVAVQVTAKAPGSGIPTGNVTISGGNSSCTAALDVNGSAICTINPRKSNQVTTISANYAGDGNYLTSSGTTPHMVNADEPPPIIPPPPDHTPVCPSIPSDKHINFSSRDRTDELVFSVKNEDTEFNINLTSVKLTWPATPLAKLQEIRFAPDTTADCKVNNTCVFDNPAGEAPTSILLNSSHNKWVTSRSLINVGETREVRLIFSSTLPTGGYQTDLTFSNGCTLHLEAAH